MRRLLFLATGAFFVVATLLPTQRAYVVQAQSAGERLATYSKPAVVRIVDGAIGQILLHRPDLAPGLTFGYRPWVRIFISSNGYIATNAHVVSITKDGEDKAKQALFWQMVQQIAQQYGQDPRSLNTNFIDQHSQLQRFEKCTT